MTNRATLDQAQFFELGSRAGNDMLLENAAVVGEAHLQRKLEAAGPKRLIGDYIFTEYHGDITWYYCDGYSENHGDERMSCIELDEGFGRTDKAWWIAPSIIGVTP